MLQMEQHAVGASEKPPPRRLAPRRNLARRQRCRTHAGRRGGLEPNRGSICARPSGVQDAGTHTPVTSAAEEAGGTQPAALDSSCIKHVRPSGRCLDAQPTSRQRRTAFMRRLLLVLRTPAVLPFGPRLSLKARAQPDRTSERLLCHGPPQLNARQNPRCVCACLSLSIGGGGERRRRRRGPVTGAMINRRRGGNGARAPRHMPS